MRPSAADEYIRAERGDKLAGNLGSGNFLERVRGTAQCMRRIGIGRAKTVEPTELPFGTLSGVSQGTVVQLGSTW